MCDIWSFHHRINRFIFHPLHDSHVWDKHTHSVSNNNLHVCLKRKWALSFASQSDHLRMTSSLARRTHTRREPSSLPPKCSAAFKKRFNHLMWFIIRGRFLIICMWGCLSVCLQEEEAVSLLSCQSKSPEACSGSGWGFWGLWVGVGVLNILSQFKWFQ